MKMRSVSFAAACMTAFACICTCPAAVSAESETITVGDFVFEENTVYGGYELTEYKAVSVEVIVPDMVKGKPVTKIGEKVFRKNQSVKRVTLPDTIKVIGTAAFSGCASLEEINMPAELEIIESDAFNSCKALKAVEFGDKVTTIKLSAFQLCTELKTLTIPGSVETVLEHSFHGLSSLQTLTFEEGVKNIEVDSFLNTSELQSVYFPRSIEIIEPYTIGFRYRYAGDELPYIKLDDVVIYGYPGTAAESYAAEYGFEFVNRALGDANDDGRFDASDAVTLQNYILGRTGECSVNADMNGDGVLNSFDICLIRKKLISEQVQAEY